MRGALSSDLALAEFLESRSPIRVSRESPDRWRWTPGQLRDHVYEQETEQFRKILDQRRTA
jgi:hypothetical protein